MKRVNEIWNHPVYQTHLTKVLRWEKSGNSAVIR